MLLSAAFFFFCRHRSYVADAPLFCYPAVNDIGVSLKRASSDFSYGVSFISRADRARATPIDRPERRRRARVATKINAKIKNFTEAVFIRRDTTIPHAFA